MTYPDNLISRYIKAAEVGRPPTSAKYELHVKLNTLRNAPVVRGQLRLPHPVKTDRRICVIAAPGSRAAQAAAAEGAVIVGEDTVFAAVKEGRIEFDTCICHTDSADKLNKAGLGRVLGPRGLMPSNKNGTIVKDVTLAVRNLVGGSIYRERMGVIRLAVGQLGFSPEELQNNIMAFMRIMKKQLSEMSDRVNKDIYEIVLSSTHGPGLSLNGTIKEEDSVDEKDLSTN